MPSYFYFDIYFFEIWFNSAYSVSNVYVSCCVMVFSSLPMRCTKYYFSRDIMHVHTKTDERTIQSKRVFNISENNTAPQYNIETKFYYWLLCYISLVRISAKRFLKCKIVLKYVKRLTRSSKLWTIFWWPRLLNTTFKT